MTDYEKKQQELLNGNQESKASQIYNKVSEVTSGKAEGALSWFQKYFTQIALAVLAFVMIGFQQFVDANFDIWFFLRASFWLEYITFITAQWIILFAVVTGNIKWLSEIEKDFLKEIDLIQAHVDRDSKTPYIALGVKDADKERKINAYRIKVSRQIEKIIKKHSFGTFSQLELFVQENKECKTEIKSKTKATKLRRKLENLLQTFDDEWIDENIQNIKVKYTQVTESGLINGFVPRSKETYVPTFKENLGDTMISEFGYGQIVAMIIGLIVLALDVSSKPASVETWAIFIFKATMLYFAYFRGNARSKIIFKKTTLKAMQERRKELDRIELKYKKA